MELESHVLSTGLASSRELLKNRKMQQPALSKTSEQKFPSSKEICPTSHSGMVLEQGSQDAFNHTGPCLAPGSSGDIQRAAPHSFSTGSSHTGWVALLCFYPEGIWLEDEPQNAVGKQSEEGPLMELGWGGAMLTPPWHEKCSQFAALQCSVPSNPSHGTAGTEAD